MNKTKFLKDRWVKFKWQDQTCIGITYYQHAANLQNPNFQMVFFITQSREVKVLNYSECKELRYLSFLKSTIGVPELKIKNEELTLESYLDLIISPNISKSTLATLAQSQCTKINRN